MKACHVWSVSSIAMGFMLSAMPLHAQEMELVHAAVSPSRAANTLVSTAQREETWFTVPDALLDQMRGGFDVGGGLVLSLGISMVTYINGQLVTETVIAPMQLDQLNQLSSEQATQLKDQISSLTVIQNGPGNRWGNYQSPNDGSAAVHQVSGVGLGTVIQNSLDNQNIQNLTVLDINTNALGLMRSNNWQNTLRDSLSSAGGVR